MDRPGLQVGIAQASHKLVYAPEVIGGPAAWTGLPLVVNEAIDVVQGLLIAIVRRPDLEERDPVAGSAPPHQYA